MSGDRAGLEGRTVMVTGASSGIGRAAASALAERGADLVLVCRDRGRGERAAAEIAAETGRSAPDLLLGDLSSLAEVRCVAGEFLATGRPLHVLLNNAGVMMSRREETVDGFERTFATNHLAYFLLTSLLLERLRETAPARVVNVASAAHAWSDGPLDFDDLQSSRRFGARLTYGRSKLANILFTRELARRLERSGVTANCLHPGFVGSRFARNNGALWSLAMTLARPFARSVAQGAETAVYLCESPDVAEVSGRYFQDCRPIWPKRYAQSDEDAARLWDLSEALTRAPGSTG